MNGNLLLRDEVTLKVDNPKVAEHLNHIASRLKGLSAMAFVYFLQQFGADPWIRKARRCEKCGSNKWTEFMCFFAQDLLAGANLIALSGFDLLPRLVKYGCNNCGHKFDFWETCGFFEEPLKGRCWRCGSGRWKKLKEDDKFADYECKQCDAPIVVDKEDKEHASTL